MYTTETLSSRLWAEVNATLRQAPSSPVGLTLTYQGCKFRVVGQNVCSYMLEALHDPDITLHLPRATVRALIGPSA